MRVEIEKRFRVARDNPSDINFHMDTLRDYCKGLNHVTEMGVRNVVSTYAFLSETERVVSYDIEETDGVKECKQTFPFWVFRKASTIEVEIEPTDMLFIDTLHTYAQLKKELELHAGKVRKYIAFHDIESFAFHGQDGTFGKGLMTAINEFLVANYGTWSCCYYTPINNGLMIIERL